MFVDVAEVEHLVGRKLTGDELVALVDLDRFAVADAEAIMARPITPELRTETYRVDHDTRVRVHATPVVTVDEVKVDGTAVTADRYVTRPWGVELFGPIGTATPATVEVTYRAGVPPSTPGYRALRSVVAHRIARVLAATAADADPNLVESLSVEGYSVKYRSSPNVRPWTDGELEVLRSFRRPVVM